MASSNTIKLVTAFLLLIVGVSLISTIASESLDKTTKDNAVDETYNLTATGCLVGGEVNESDADCNVTVSNAPTSWKVNDCPLTNFVIGNSTEDLTLSTDYNVNLATGTVHLLNTSGTAANGDNYLIDYTYCADNYLNSSWGRTLLLLVGGFFALALLLIAVGLFYSVAKDSGILK